VDADLAEPLVEAFEAGLVIQTGEDVPSRDYVRLVRETPGLGDAIARLGVGESPASIASAVEFVLEGLHLHRRLNKDRASGVVGGGRYRA
jgi:magnesium chelatase subunit I